jgi:hypothetical protein
MHKKLKSLTVRMTEREMQTLRRSANKNDHSLSEEVRLRMSYTKLLSKICNQMKS